MIVDCYTHTWENADQLGRGVGPLGQPATGGVVDRGVTGTDISHHWAAVQPIDTTVVLGFRSHYLDAEIPNDRVAAYVAEHPGKLIGFAGIDPSEPNEAREEIERARAELSLHGLSVAPAAQNFHPSDSRAMVVYAAAAEARLPVLFHAGVQVSSATNLEFARPILLDEIARELPQLKLVIAHMGHPWERETAMLLTKHANVYAEISWLLDDPWQAYQALLYAHQLGVTDKLLFGSGFPHSSAPHCIEELYGISHLVHGTNLPTIPREHLRGIVERDALALLGIAAPAEMRVSQPAADSPEDEQR